MHRFKRLHRYRQSETMRQILEETAVSVTDFIYPLFISETASIPQPIQSMPGMFQHTVSSVLDEVGACVELGLKTFILFGIPQHKDAHGSASYDFSGIVQQTIRAIKKTYPETIVIADCCLCEYTDHGHCGVLTPTHGLNNDATLGVLNQIAVSYAEAGVDIVAPSGMMDGMIQSLREALDQAGYTSVSLMSYAIKYASQLYGPFREAAGSTFTSNRLHHQLNPTQRKEALLESRADEKEGADFLMVKPSGFYLDMIRELANETLLPVVAYQVSGEYSMLKLASEKGLFDERHLFMESFIGLKRSGASLIITYYAKEMATWLKTR